MKKQRRRAALAACAVGLFWTSSAGANLLTNGDFSSGTANWNLPGWWNGGSSTHGVENGRFCITVHDPGNADWSGQLTQSGLPIYQGAAYTMRFKAWTDTALNLAVGTVDEAAGVWNLLAPELGGWPGPVAIPVTPLDGAATEISVPLVANADSASGTFRFLFGLGSVPAGTTLCLDDVALDGPLNLIGNSTFSTDALGWLAGFWGDGRGSATVVNGQYCADIVDNGTADWNVQLRYDGIAVKGAREYNYSVDVTTTLPGTIRIDGMDEADGYNQHFVQDTAVAASATPTRLSGKFTAKKDTSTLQFRIVLGSDALMPDGARVCVDNVRLLDPQAAPAVEEPPPPPIAVNQVGYLPAFAKHATYAVAPTAPLPTCRAPGSSCSTGRPSRWVRPRSSARTRCRATSSTTSTSRRWRSRASATRCSSSRATPSSPATRSPSRATCTPA